VVPIAHTDLARLIATHANCLEIARVDQEYATDRDHIKNCRDEDEKDDIELIVLQISEANIIGESQDEG